MIYPGQSYLCQGRDSKLDCVTPKEYKVGVVTEKKPQQSQWSIFKLFENHQEGEDLNFPDGLMDKTLCSQNRGPRFYPWSGNQIPCAATKTWHSQIIKKKKKAENLGNLQSKQHYFERLRNQRHLDCYLSPCVSFSALASPWKTRFYSIIQKRIMYLNNHTI